MRTHLYILMLATKHTNIPKYVYPGEFLVCDSRLSSFLSAQKENLRLLRQRGRRNEKKRTKRGEGGESAVHTRVAGADAKTIRNYVLWSRIIYRGQWGGRESWEGRGEEVRHGPREISFRRSIRTLESSLISWRSPSETWCDDVPS